MAARLLAPLALALALASSLACSTSTFEVTEPEGDATGDDGVDASTEDSSPGKDAATSPDTNLAPDSATPDSATPDSTTPDSGARDVAIADTATPPDTLKVDTAPVDTGCPVGATQDCECGGFRTCLMSGAWGACEMKCPVAPARYLCAFGHDGCTDTTCLDSNNCSAKCRCGSFPGTTCMLIDPCWGFACNGFVCP